MARISRFDLNWYAKSDYRNRQGRRFLKESQYLAKKRIFLSHSHKDKKLVKGLANLLASMGIKLYIDWQDDNMPRITNRETADKIKKRISSSDLLMLLATKNAINSRWVPWEVGVGDSTLNERRIVVVPVEDNDGKFYGNEYLQLYRRLEYDSTEGLQLFKPQYEYTFDNFANHLKSIR